MKTAFVLVMCSTLAGALALPSPVQAQEKTAKACADEWRADKKANQDKGITQKDYVAKCRGGAKAATPAAAKEDKAAAAAKAKEEKAAAAAKAKEEKAAAAAKAKEEKAAAAKEKTAAKEKAPAAAGAKGKTVKACEDEWRADKKANQDKGITQKAYVESCRGTPAAATPAADSKAKETAAPAAPKAKETAAPAAPAAKETAKKETSAPGAGKPEGANQYASETLAKVHCITGTVVWANLDSKIYHFAGHSDYGHTKQGAYMCEKDAMAQEMRAAKNEKRP
jgi:hypothetical protein